jgi:hypothetical protein
MSSGYLIKNESSGQNYMKIRQLPSARSEKSVFWNSAARNILPFVQPLYIPRVAAKNFAINLKDFVKAMNHKITLLS